MARGRYRGRLKPQLKGFHRTCLLCGRGFRDIVGLTRAGERALQQQYAAAHLEHFYAMAKPGEYPHRCASDGTLLLWRDKCPEHVFSGERVRWDPPMAAAYNSIIEGMAGGRHVPLTPEATLRVQRAYGLAKAWGMRKDVWLRPEVVVA